MKRIVSAGIAGFLVAPLLFTQADAATETTLTLSNPCAVFNEATEDPYVTRISYGEDIDFKLTGQSQAIVDVDGDGMVHLKFQVVTHGDGTGLESGIKYQFKSKVMLKSNAGGYDPLEMDPLDPGFTYSGSFVADARIIGQGSAGDVIGVAQGAQDNAELKFKIGLRFSNGEIRSTTSDFALTCVASPWTNLMGAKQAGTKESVGRGFGDPWNKYAWSMKDFGGGMIVGTKNAFYDIDEMFSPSDSVQNCLDTGFYQVTDIHAPLACMELFASPNSGTSPAAADTRFAEIWRYDYVKKTWTNVFDDAPTMGSQGFRYMEVHNGKLYVGSDLGAFITGVDLFTGSPYNWDFPGSRVLVSTDGKNFNEVESCQPGLMSPCNATSHADNGYGLIGTYPNYTGAVNISIRAMASYNDELFVGTFNMAGAQLWAYKEGRTPEWRLVQIFPGIFTPNELPKPAVAELRVAGGKLYIGLAGPSGNNYLWSCDNGCQYGSAAPVTGQPYLDPSTNVGNLKLFTSSSGLLYVGNVDLDKGFYLQVHDPSEETFREITSNGFFNDLNAYAWSIAEINGRVFVGTFNQDMLSSLPRGDAEIWYSDDSYNWQQMALPLDWGLWNYGIRTMEVGNRMLFLGAASNMVAPDLITEPVPLSPGTEVWTIRDTHVAPTGKTDGPPGKKTK